MPDQILRQTPFGSLSGATSGGVTRFHRVPYSQPRLGVDRFARPTEPPVWHGIRDATRPGPVPPQLPSRLDGVMGIYDCAQDEDCLHLDIWQPEGLSAPAPVIAFIHGGAFMTGGGSMPCYDGAALARATGCVVVTISYRLGILGFLPVEEAGALNLGLHDQIAALRWIRQAIGAFGGDAGNVTAIGQSAGAFSIAAFMALPLGPSLFDKAVLMSAPLGIRLRTPAEAAGIRHALLRELGGAPGDLEPLRRAPVGDLLAALEALGRKAPPPAEPGTITPPFMPVLDPELIPRDPLDALVEGAGAWCPVVIGVTREEHASFHMAGSPLDTLTEAGLGALFTREYGAEGPQRLAQARARRSPATPRTLVIDLRGELDFVAAAWTVAAAQVRHGQGASHAYRFDWQSPMPGLGAGHCLDLPFLFGTPALWEAMPMVRGAERAEVEGLSTLFQGAIAAFARSGSPSGPALPRWPAFGPDRTILQIDRLSAATRLCD
ncbi:carboxylesterase/lipase family protein [Pararhodobacter aggregans]|uniref:carboxylesterase/lipase family protein n=1 Tax=Pararhodobacter aggregans TaxID=404875 RepID=UPI003A8D7929